LKGKKALVVDIGGGSCELVIGDSKRIYYNESLNLGSTRLTRLFLKSNPVRPYEIQTCQDHLDAVFKRIKLAAKKHTFDLIIGTGGSLNNLTRIIYGQNNQSANDLMKEVALSEVDAFNQDLIGKTYRQRIKLPNMEKKRVDIILAAGLVISKIMNFFEVSSFTSLGKGL
jgi:exopolyphosphatase/guanosine-5'-triphosphate,3'-diphosphate pyrophosphatase